VSSGPWRSPKGAAGEGGELGVGGEQHQPLQFGLGGEHAIKGIAVRLVVGAGANTMGQGDRQGLEAIGLQQAWQIANGLRQRSWLETLRQEGPALPAGQLVSGHRLQQGIGVAQGPLAAQTPGDALGRRWRQGH
jgi:hypothetical protein